ncbi:MAG: AraC family transcriptional regulator [Allomuricauda sp.]
MDKFSNKIESNKVKPTYLSIDSSPGSSFAVRLFECDVFPTNWHFHPQYELTYMVSSTGLRYIGDNIGNFHRGDLILLGPNLAHSWKTVGKQDEKVCCVIIQWNDAFFGSWLNKEELQPITKMLRLSERGLKFDLNKSLDMEETFIRLPGLDPMERLFSFLDILKELASSVDYEIVAGTSFTNKLSHKESERINIIYDFVGKNHLRRITLDEIAGKVSLSKEAFCRFFKRNFNKSFFVFVNEYKISLAGKLLIDTDLSIAEIAYKSGYNNLTFFHRQFHKFMLMPPSRYRQNYRKIPSLH